MIGGVGGLETELLFHSLGGPITWEFVMEPYLYTKTKWDIDGHLFAQ